MELVSCCFGLLVAILALACVTCDDQACTTDGTCDDPNCTDNHKNCLQWAERSECENNEGFMTSECGLSCEKCTGRLPDWEDPECEDLHPKCEEWAGLKECIANPGYMLHACKKSCNLCIDIKKARSEGLDEDEILRRFRFMKADWGAIQNTPTDGDKAKVEGILKAMTEYSLNNVTMFPLDERILCKNKHNDCAFWAAQGQCESNLQFMMSDCPLVCQFCDKKMVYEKCKDEKPSDSWIEAGSDLKFSHLKSLKGAELVSSAEVGSLDDPWVLKWDGFLSSQHADELRALAKTLVWESSSVVMPSELKETGLVRRLSKSAYCTSRDCKDEKAYQQVRTLLSKIVQADLKYVEPLEFVHYTNLQSFGSHHDFRLHDIWMPAGPRVLSIFLCLSDVPKGGAMGFPDLDWLSIPPKKGQLLIWPNVLSSAPKQRRAEMSSEGLPVLEGEKYGIHTWVRLYDYEAAETKGCV